MVDKITNLYIATSGWSYNWKGFFYPENLKSADYLNYYASQFNATEINSSFYHFTMVKTIEKWLTTTPDNFKFCPKINRQITHYSKLKNVEQPLKLFMDRFSLMGNRLGPVLIQLPASFKFDNSLVEDFYKLLRTDYPDKKFAIEVRHPSWFSDNSLDLMKKYNIIFVIASSGVRFPYFETVTSNSVYLRLHGDEKLYSSSYTDQQLKKYAEMVISYLKEKKEVWIFFNNTMDGAAVSNAKAIKQMIESSY